ncbi:MAG TPA: hypothetical protein VKM55_02940 [Candidatus Lokiarchaeia archaeon]|nr:hypothetical protein [Candidatus Lokiarchaeia archaeon]
MKFEKNLIQMEVLLKWSYAAAILIQMGILLEKRHQFDEAEEKYKMAQHIMATERDPPELPFFGKHPSPYEKPLDTNILMAQSFAGLGRIDIERENFKNALEHRFAAIEFLKLVENPDEKTRDFHATMLFDASAVLIHEEKNDLAIALLKEAIQKFQALDNTDLEALSTWRLAKIYGTRNDFSSARPLFERGTNLFIKMGNWGDAIQVNLTLIDLLQSNDKKNNIDEIKTILGTMMDFIEKSHDIRIVEMVADRLTRLSRENVTLTPWYDFIKKFISMCADSDLDNIVMMLEDVEMLLDDE